MRASGGMLLFAVVVSLLGCKPTGPAVKETPIRIVEEKIGVGRPATKGDLVTINYRVVTEDDQEILSEDGYRFIMGTGSVIEGIEDAVRGMRITGERLIVCPPHRHWGRHGYGDRKVPANAMLSIQIKLESID